MNVNNTLTDVDYASIEKKIISFLKEKLEINPSYIRVKNLTSTSVEIYCYYPLAPTSYSFRSERGIFSFSLTQMPGCCGLLISHNTWVDSMYRGKGIAQFLQDIKESIAVEAGYSQLICTANNKERAQLHILGKNHWESVVEFHNKRSGNAVYIYVKDI